MASEAINQDLPAELLDQLRLLDLELEEGDITQKGYEKKKASLLQDYAYSSTPATPIESTAVTSTSRTASQPDYAFSSSTAGPVPVPHDVAQEDTLDDHGDHPPAEECDLDLDPEPSAADAVDFLDFLPSPTHSPREDRGASLMEENHQRLQSPSGSQIQLGPTSPTDRGGPYQAPSWQQQQPQQPYGSNPAGGAPMGQAPGNPYGASQGPGGIASPRPNWQYDPRTMSRPQYQQNTMWPPNNYGAYPGQPRPMYNRPPPPANQPFSPRPAYSPYGRPMPPPGPPQQGTPRPMYRPPNTMSPRPMYGNVRPGPPNPPPPAAGPMPGPPSSYGQPPRGHARTSSLESRSDANSVMQPPSARPATNYGYNGEMQPAPSDDWETASMAGTNNWRPPPGRAPSIMSATPTRASGSHFAMMDNMARMPLLRRSSANTGRSRYGNSYMATSFKAVEPAPQPKLTLDDPMEQMMMADLAGRQLLPLEARGIPFRVLDSVDQMEMNTFSNLAEILRHRATKSSHCRSPAFTVVDARGKETASYTWEKLNARAEKVAQVIREKSGLHAGDRVALIYRKSEQLEFIVALLGCFLAGMVAVPINAAEELAELSFILNLTNAYLILTTDINLRTLTRDMQARNIEFPANIDWWKTNDFGSWYPKKSGGYPSIRVLDLAYVEYAKAPNGELKGVTVNHKTIMSECTAIMASMTDTSSTVTENGEVKLTPKYKVRGSDCMVTYLEHRQQMGLVFSVLWSIFSGCHTVFASSSIVDTPAVWIYVVSKYQASITLGEYSALKSITQYYQAHTKEVHNQSKKVIPDFSSLRFLMLDTVVVNPALNDFIAKYLLEPLKNPNPTQTVCPVASLPEHGGMIMSFRDHLGPVRLEEEKVFEDGQEQTHSVLATGGSRDTWECLLDAESLRLNKVVVLATGEESKQANLTAEPGRIRVGAFGFVMPEATVAIVDPETGMLCPSDTIGEVWIDAPSLSGGFWALPKHTEAIFHARSIVVPADTMHPEVYDQEFLRTGLVGTLIGGRLVVLGTYEDRIRQQRLGETFGLEEAHFAADLTETLNKQARIDHCAIFEIAINDQHLPVVVYESSVARSELAKISATIVDVMLAHHGLRVYGVVVVAPNALPREAKHDRRRIHTLMVKRAFMTGQLNIRHIKMDVDRTIFNLVMNDDPNHNIWQSGMAYDRAIRTGQIMPRPQQQHTGMETVREVVDERTDFDLSKFSNIIDVLLWRTRLYPEETGFVAVTQLNSGGPPSTKPYTWRKINSKIAMVANYLMKRGFKRGRKALVVVPFGIEWIQAIYGCLTLGVIPIPFEPPDALQPPQRIKEDVNSLVSAALDLDVTYIVVNSESEDVLKNKHVQPHLRQVLSTHRDPKTKKSLKLPEFTNINKASKTTKMLGKESGLFIKPEWSSTGENLPALVTVHKALDGHHSYVSIGHETILAQCRAQKVTCQMKSLRAIVGTGLGAYQGLSLLHYAMCGVYVGAPTILLSTSDFYTAPATFFELLQRYKAKDVCVTHPLLQYAMNRITPTEHRTFVLQNVQNMMLVTEERPKPILYQHIARFFAPNRLDPAAINTVYSHAANPMATTRSYMLIEPISLLVDVGWLRHGIVRPLPYEDEAYGLTLHDSGIVPSNTMVAIVNPETRSVCPSNIIGEIWIASDCNVRSFHGLSESAHNAKFEATLPGADPRIKYMRTGDLGFLWNVQRRVDGSAQPMVEEGQCLFVLGSKSEIIERDGLIHFPFDIELSVERCHPGIVGGGCIVFQAHKEIVAVVAIKSTEQALSAVPLVVSAILDNHSCLVDTVVVVHSNQFPRTRFGDKQRTAALAAYMDKTLPVVYVSRITNQHEPLSLPQWSQSQMNLENDTGSVISAHTTTPQSAGAQSITGTELDRSGSLQSRLQRGDTSSSRQSINRNSMPSSPAVSHVPEGQEPYLQQQEQQLQQQ